jgi:uncharacterized protein
MSGMSQHYFPAPQSAVSLVRGKVMHARFKPRTNRFAYDVACIVIDIDKLAIAHKTSRLFSVERFNLFGFYQRDHGLGDAVSLRAHVDSLLAPCAIDLTGGRVLLLCYPRVLGYVFDPLSVYYCYDKDGALVAAIYEVRNTFGDRHTYVAPVAAGELSEAGLRQERDKLFYVSPFLDMNMRYRFRLLPPGEKVSVRILETDPEGPIMAASFHGVLEDLTTGGLLRAFFQLPLMTAKVVAGIHWEALKLWLKGVKFHARPEPPPPASYVLPDRGTRDPYLR